ncbi:hypothetical protein ACS8YF_19455, partial [Salinisphaera sp. SWV1]|uniref:hypothetical protein n=1 Tax=Salinisphaera sp. SWV1 TaxID=3454139 RepID=UPI003F8375DB
INRSDIDKQAARQRAPQRVWASTPPALHPPSPGRVEGAVDGLFRSIRRHVRNRAVSGSFCQAWAAIGRPGAGDRRYPQITPMARM